MGDRWNISQIHKANEFSFEKEFPWEMRNIDLQNVSAGGGFENLGVVSGRQLAQWTGKQSESYSQEVIWSNPAPVWCFLHGSAVPSTAWKLPRSKAAGLYRSPLKAAHE